MPRQARQDAFGAFHHVIMRGIDRRTIFHADSDRYDFTTRLSEQLRAGGGACLAWVLMPNHVHLVLRTGLRPLSSVMRRLNGGFARAYNLRHGRSGYLFQGRFWSAVVEDDAYLQTVVAYVHLNPLRAGLVASVEDLGSYRWSGFSEALGRSPVQLLDWHQLEAVMGEGWSLVESSIAWSRECDDPSGTLLPPEGSVPQRSDAASASTRPPRASNPPACDLDQLIECVCLEFGVDPAVVRRGRRSRAASRARAVIAALGTIELGISQDAIAKATRVSPAAICRSLERGMELARNLELSLAGFERAEKVN